MSLPIFLARRTLSPSRPLWLCCLFRNVFDPAEKKFCTNYMVLLLQPKCETDYVKNEKKSRLDLQKWRY